VNKLKSLQHNLLQNLASKILCNEYMNSHSIPTPEILDISAVSEFEREANSQNLDVNDLWVGGYVEYEWQHLRHVLETYYESIAGLNILEFGCNFGASSIVLAQMGANVTAIDVNENYVNLAKKNAAQYRLQDKINFNHTEDTQTLPFDTGQFDLVIANSVLEYVPHKILKTVLLEIDRVLKVGGDIQILGTSSRLAPKEVHDETWLINYVPRCFDKLIFKDHVPLRGMWPWTPINTLKNYKNKDYENKSQHYLLARKKLVNQNYTYLY